MYSKSSVTSMKLFKNNDLTVKNSKKNLLEEIYTMINTMDSKINDIIEKQDILRDILIDNINGKMYNVSDMIYYDETSKK